MARYHLYGLELETDFTFSWPVPPSLLPPGALAPPGSPTPRGFPASPEAPGSVAPVIHFRCSPDPPGDHLAARGQEPPAPGKVTFIAGDRSRQIPDVLRFGGAADHYVWDHEIHCHLPDPSLAYLVEIQLLGTVLALWLHRRGVPILHAAAVGMGESAAAFAGVKGAGKSTLAAAAVAGGHALLADDLLALNLSQEDRHTPTVAQGNSGIPLLRLTPEQSRKLGIPIGSSLVHPAFPKRKLVVGGDWGRFHHGTLPVRCIYIPNPRRPEDGPGLGVSFEALPHRHVLPLLTGHSYLGPDLEAWGMSKSAFPLWATFLTRHRVQAFRLNYPLGFRHLPAVVAAVEAHLSESNS